MQRSPTLGRRLVLDTAVAGAVVVALAVVGRLTAGPLTRALILQTGLPQVVATNPEALHLMFVSLGWSFVLPAVFAWIAGLAERIVGGEVPSAGWLVLYGVVVAIGMVAFVEVRVLITGTALAVVPRGLSPTVTVDGLGFDVAAWQAGIGAGIMTAGLGVVRGWRGRVARGHPIR